MKNFFLSRWQNFKLFDKNLMIYFMLLSFLLLFFNENVNGWFYHSLYHLALVALVWITVSWLSQQSHPIFKFLRNWYIIIALPFLYWDVGQYLHVIHSGEFDLLIIRFDQWLFGELPNIWVQQHVTDWLTEFMQISYSIYWITIPLGGAVFYFSGNEKLDEHLLHLVTITFFLSYFVFIVFPVAGPRFYIADQITASYDGLLFTNFLRSFMQDAGFRGGAFPSSHVGVAVVILIFVTRYKPKTGILLFFPLVFSLSIATVYGQYHYLTDILAGFVMGIAFGIWGVKWSDSRLSKNL